MATLTNNLVNKMIPDVYDGRGDIDIFINECKRYFELCGLSQENQNMMIKCLIARDMLPIYESVDVKHVNFEDRLRAAFKKPTSLIGDFLKLCQYEKENDIAPVFFEKIEKMVDQILQHKWDKNELIAYFLVHCVKDKEIQKEIKMRDAVKVEEIKEVIRKVDAINIEVSSIAVMQRKETFANVIKKRQGFAEIQDRHQRSDQRNERPRFNQMQEKEVPEMTRKYESRDFRRQESRTMITCWNCQGNGHFSRECPKKKVPICFQCGKEGHMIRECQNRTANPKIQCTACKETGHHRGACPSISCSGCGRRGHLRFQCWSSGGQQYRPNEYAGRYDERRRFEASRYTDDRGRTSYRNVAAMQSDEEAGEDSESRRGDGNPNAEAPSLGEMIGAMD